MNIRKNIDYSEMYKDLDDLMAKELTQMELYCEIGKAVCQRTEKGAAVMASEYLNKHYPDAKGFSPRSLRRMRDFYRTYENHPALLKRAMEIGWIQNVVIMEADLTMELREWYMKAAKQFAWSKTELIAFISQNAYENIVLEDEQLEDEGKMRQSVIIFEVIACMKYSLQYLSNRCWRLHRKVNRRRWQFCKDTSELISPFRTYLANYMYKAKSGRAVIVKKWCRNLGQIS